MVHKQYSDVTVAVLLLRHVNFFCPDCVSVTTLYYVHVIVFSTRPFLSVIEKKWIVFQLLKSLEECHSKKVNKKLLFNLFFLLLVFLNSFYVTETLILCALVHMHQRHMVVCVFEHVCF